MSPEFRDLVGDDLSPEERAELERVDRLLRSVPAPPAEIPGSLTRAVDRIGTHGRFWTKRRLSAVAAVAAALAALSFGVGRWSGLGDDPDYARTVALQPTSNARGANGVIRLSERDEASGNWSFELAVSGLPKLSGSDYYVLWLAKDGKYAATCGTFNVGDGTTKVSMNASYRLNEFDAWVVSRHEEGSPWLLSAET
jgi:Anti-sigma-K factor rskA, C-terminal